MTSTTPVITGPVGGEVITGTVGCDLGEGRYLVIVEDERRYVIHVSPEPGARPLIVDPQSSLGRSTRQIVEALRSFQEAVEAMAIAAAAQRGSPPDERRGIVIPAADMFRRHEQREDAAAGGERSHNP